MKTDDLIAALAADTVRDPGPPRLLWPLMLPALALSGAALFATSGFRPGLLAALADPMVAAKVLLPLALGLLAAAVALRLARPAAGAGRLAPALLAVPAIAAVLVTVTLGLNPPAAWGMLLTGKTMVWCLTLIPAMAVLPLAGALWAIRQGAPTDAGRAGAAAGLASGALSAAVYALHCPEDSPLFFTAWYGTAILMVAAAGALVGARVLRW